VSHQVTGGPLRPEETVIVTAAAGGTGHFAVQLAKLAGCHVIATCGGADKAEALKTLGVDRVIDYKAEVGLSWQTECLNPWVSMANR
jgi:NADPH-dependent curcumin reductase CurA